MFLIQILIPLTDNEGKKFSSEKFSSVKDILMKKFGGLTVFSQAPAVGLWEKTKKEVLRDQIVVFEIMTKKKKYNWWKDFRKWLEKEFEQDLLLSGYLPWNVFKKYLLVS